MNPWHNKIIFITGAGSGIGLSIVKRALDKGAKVSAVFRSESSQLQTLACDNLLTTKGDVTDRNDLALAIKNTIETFNQIDIIVNNAGAMYYMDIINPDYQQMQDMIATNCVGFINLLQEALPILIKRQKGHWINITSDAGRRPFPGLAIYSGTKAFIEFSASAMRQELIKHNIKVTNIQPGNVRTPLHTKSTITDEVTQFISEDSGQYLSTQDIVNAIEYALSTPMTVAVNEILLEPLSESI